MPEQLQKHTPLVGVILAEERECKMDSLMEAVIEEVKRRGLVVNASCKYCGEVFLKQELEYILAHTEVCEGRENDN